MKKFLLATTAAAIAMGFSGLAMAAVNLDTGVGSGGTYASELVIPAPSLTLGAGAEADQTVNVALGAAFGTGTPAYVRFDLTNGTFAANPTITLAGDITSALVSQGGAGQNFVIFELSPAALGNLQAGTNVELEAAGVTVTNQSGVSIQYRLFETLTAAVNPSAANTLKTAARPFLAFANAIRIDLATTPDAVADVAAPNGPYTAFLPTTGLSATNRQISNFHVVYTPRALANGAQTTLAALLADTNAVRIEGDFAAADTVTIKANAACFFPAAITATLNAARTQATFSGIPAAAITANTWYVCYNHSAGNTTPIPASTFSGVVDLAPAGAAVAVADGPAAAGRIVRNGTVLKAAFAEASGVSGWASAVSITNTSGRPATFSTSCLVGNGRVAGASQTVAANTGTRFGITSAAGLGCPSGVRGIELSFNVPTGSVIGSVVRQNTTTGQAAFDTMVGSE